MASRSTTAGESRGASGRVACAPGELRAGQSGAGQGRAGQGREGQAGAGIGVPFKVAVPVGGGAGGAVAAVVGCCGRPPYDSLQETIISSSPSPSLPQPLPSTYTCMPARPPVRSSSRTKRPAVIHLT
ncbi:hypothetical protein E2C01_015593 [Portunus trituberculatus]|uniref:Uncharacterized protein n=1 Tax=Portunus trituberculatus TaxID=210409 RepID=A0A5B7DNQ2_PORTR|nr:hypothetical protein [Portunus trituberculatus]